MFPSRLRLRRENVGGQGAPERLARLDVRRSIDQVATVMPDGLPEIAACAREVALVKPGTPGRLREKACEETLKGPADIH